MELPGFIFDPTNGKYYKDDEHGRKIVRQNIMKKQNETKTIVKKPHILSLLTQRQLGMGTGSFPAKFIRTLVNSMPSGTQHYTFRGNFDLTFLIEGPDRMYVIFNIDDYSMISVVPYLYKNRIETNRNHIYEMCYITDVCQSSVKDRVGFVCNSSRNGYDIWKFVDLDINNRNRHSLSGSSSPIWCCAGSPTDNIYAIGSDSHIKILRIQNSQWMPKKVLVKNGEKVTAMQFDATGDLLFFGTHSGFVGMFNLKTEKLDLKRISKDYINALVVLDENNLICSTMNNQLMKVDVQTLVPNFVFEGHVSQSGRHNLSVCGLHNLLCCTGSDQTTRVWSLYEPRPLLEMPTQVEGIRSQGLLHHEDDHCVLYVMTGGKMMWYDLFSAHKR